jgi:hypothetical protein
MVLRLVSDCSILGRGRAWEARRLMIRCPACMSRIGLAGLLDFPDRALDRRIGALRVGLACRASGKPAREVELPFMLALHCAAVHKRAFVKAEAGMEMRDARLEVERLGEAGAPLEEVAQVMCGRCEYGAGVASVAAQSAALESQGAMDRGVAEQGHG